MHERGNVRIVIFYYLEPDPFTLLCKPFHGCIGLCGAFVTGQGGASALCRNGIDKEVAPGCNEGKHHFQPIDIEIDVGQGMKEGFDSE